MIILVKTLTILVAVRSRWLGLRAAVHRTDPLRSLSVRGGERKGAALLPGDVPPEPHRHLPPAALRNFDRFQLQFSSGRLVRLCLLYRRHQDLDAVEAEVILI